MARVRVFLAEDPLERPLDLDLVLHEGVLRVEEEPWTDYGGRDAVPADHSLLDHLAGHVAVDGGVVAKPSRT